MSKKGGKNGLGVLKGICSQMLIDILDGPLCAYLACFGVAPFFQQQLLHEIMCGPLLKALTLFVTKICYIPHPIYDLTKNLKPYLLPFSKI